MTHLRNSILAGAALILGAGGSAQAADLYGGRQGGLKDYGYQQPAIATSPSIYVRIDGGIASHDRPHMVLDGTQDLTNTSFDRAWAVGGGIGTYFTQNVRGDITVDYRFKSDVKGTWNFNEAGTQAVVEGVNGLRSTVVLANAYYDFDVHKRFTPYIGIGLGVVNHEVSAGTFASASRHVTGVIDGYENWGVAGALMAGFSSQLRDRLHFDAGYRFLYLGATSTGAARATNIVAAVPESRDPTIEDLHAHEFRFGLRYDIR